MRYVDVVALVTGLLLTAAAVVALWLAVAGSMGWSRLSVLAPIALVGVGVLGLALSRNRDGT